MSARLRTASLVERSFRQPSLAKSAWPQPSNNIQLMIQLQLIGRNGRNHQLAEHAIFYVVGVAWHATRLSLIGSEYFFNQSEARECSLLF